ncbi:partial nebramycin 5' synthase, partial [Patescibacteria group bacterium]
SVPIFFVRHHIAHAASMPIDVHQLDNESLFLVMDGRGEWDTITAWLLKNGDLKNVLHTGMPHTIGDMYNMMGRFMGWREFGFEGQIMGLAPYGEPRNPHEHKLYEIVASAYKDFAQIQLDTLNFKLNPKYFFGSFQPEYLAQVRGWVTPYTPSPYFLELLAPQFSPMPEGEQIDPSNPNHRPVCVLAYALQNRTQELILSLVENLKLQFPYIKSLCVSGGVALNVTTNGEIIRRGLFNNDNFITTPVPGDDGLSIGAALYFLHFYNRHQEVKRSYSSALLGREYSAFDVKVTLERFGLIGDKDCMEYFDLDDLVDTVATLIQQGHGIAWFQGREEAGPRALGARSILFPLSDPNSNLRANKSKRRQPWRPSAISILEEDAGLFLEHCTIAPYMSIAYLPSALNKQVFQSGLHPADNSTRPQTVNDEDAPHLSRLLKKIKHKTGLGAVLNTSFNRSEPIVHFPEDALNTLYYLEGVEYLAISNFLIRKGTYKPSIIAAAEEAKMQSAFKAFRETRNAHELLKILQSYPTYPQQVQIVFDGKYKIPMFKEGFDSKNLKDVIDCLSVTENFSDNTAIEIKPHDTPYKPVILRLLTNINRKSVL